MRPTILPLLLGGLLLATAGCGGDDTPSGRSGSPAAPPPEVDACAGVAGCVGVGRADVDGDGHPDTIGLAYANSVYRLYVGAGGTVQSVEQRISPYTMSSPDPTTAYIGAFHLRTTGAADVAILMGTGYGNPDDVFVVGWRGGRLASIPAPNAADNTSDAPTNAWVFGRSHGTSSRLRCVDGGIELDVRRYPVIDGNLRDGDLLRQVDRFSWKDDAWYPEGSENSMIPPDPSARRWDPKTDTFACKDLTEPR